jgi:hypothetical protein
MKHFIDENFYMSFQIHSVYFSSIELRNQKTITGVVEKLY